MESDMHGLREESVPAQCRCGYKWSTKTKKVYVSCPGCHYPMKTEVAIRNAKEADMVTP